MRAGVPRGAAEQMDGAHDSWETQVVLSRCGRITCRYVVIYNHGTSTRVVTCVKPISGTGKTHCISTPCMHLEDVMRPTSRRLG